MVNFTKVHGNGNDFLVIENREGRYTSDDLAQLAKSLCRRKFSIGADGILIVENAADADFAMRIFNEDGSEGEMCGNGARALARYAFETKLTGASLCFSTPAGLMRAVVEPPYVELDMGELDLSTGVFGECLRSRDMEFPFVFLTVGVPHCVLFSEDNEAMDDATKTAIGKEVSHDFVRFPMGCNVTFAQVVSKGDIKAVTYERGVEGLTESCGTGSVAVAIASAIVRDCSPTVKVHNPGGVNEVRLIFGRGNASCHAYLKGKTALVAKGTALPEAWL